MDGDTYWSGRDTVSDHFERARAGFRTRRNIEMCAEFLGPSGDPAGRRAVCRKEGDITGRKKGVMVAPGLGKGVFGKGVQYTTNMTVFRRRSLTSTAMESWTLRSYAGMAQHWMFFPATETVLCNLRSP